MTFMEGRVFGTYSTTSTSYPVTVPTFRLTIKPYGIRSFSHDDNGNIVAVSEEELREIAEALKIRLVDARWLCANLSIIGIAGFSGLAKGTQLEFDGGAVLKVAGKNTPTVEGAKILRAEYEVSPMVFTKAATNKCGLSLAVVNQGIIKNNASFRIQTP